MCVFVFLMQMLSHVNEKRVRKTELIIEPCTSYRDVLAPPPIGQSANRTQHSAVFVEIRLLQTKSISTPMIANQC